MFEKLLKILLCKFKFHQLDIVDSHILLKEMGERWVRYECSCCGEFKLKCYKTHKSSSK